MSINDRTMVLFICTHNSARSQMAEALLNKLGGEKYIAYSGGTDPTAVNPHAIKAMADIGIDITGKQAKHVNTYKGQTFDYVITVCDHAKETCPFFPGAKKYLHQGFQDPSGFIGTEEEKDAAFRRVRDEIKSWIESVLLKEE